MPKKSSRGWRKLNPVRVKTVCHPSNLHFEVADATTLPYDDNSFDVVLIANALHVMPAPEKALKEI